MEEINLGSSSKYESEIERSVAHMLTQMGLNFEYSERGPYDFRINGKDDVMFLELKGSLTHSSRNILKKIISRLEILTSETERSSALIVSSEPIPSKFQDFASDKVKLMDLKAFRDFIRSWSQA